MGNIKHRYRALSDKWSLEPVDGIYRPRTNPDELKAMCGDLLCLINDAVDDIDQLQEAMLITLNQMTIGDTEWVKLHRIWELTNNALNQSKATKKTMNDWAFSG